MTILFWSAVVLMIYIFAGYPLLLALWGAVRSRPWRREDAAPNVSVVISAHNEAASIARKIENLLSLDYPSDRLEILVGSDGSTDATAEVLRSFNDVRLRAFIFENRRGKPAVLNTLIPKAHGDIVVLCDVRQMFDEQALTALTRPFADPQVGAVTGELMLTGGGSAGAYWRYEKFIRSRECVVNSTIVVTGAIYAIRRELFEPIPADTVVDDLLIPMRIARRGYRIVFERDAVAYECAGSNRQEFRRKVRTLSGLFQFFARERWVFNPVINRLWWQTMSHKAARLLVAPLQLIALISNISLALPSPVYQLLLIAQILFYIGAIAGLMLPQGARRPVALSFPYTFCLLSWATVCAFTRWILRRQSVTWEKVASF
jgi:biofilm PGA synthesis N-glycosyltransferase PgaC